MGYHPGYCLLDRSVRPLSTTDDVDHLGVHATVRRDDLAEPGIERSAVQRTDLASGLFDQQRPGGDVPWVEADLPEAVEPAARDVREIDRCRTEAADCTGGAQEVREESDEVVRL